MVFCKVAYAIILNLLYLLFSLSAVRVTNLWLKQLICFCTINVCMCRFIKRCMATMCSFIFHSSPSAKCRRWKPNYGNRTMEVRKNDSYQCMVPYWLTTVPCSPAMWKVSHSSKNLHIFLVWLWWALACLLVLCLSSSFVTCWATIEFFFYDNKFDAIAQVNRNSYMYIYELVSI